MSQVHQLDWATGLYKHDQDNHFVISARADQLYLKLDETTEEKLIARGDGLYQVEKTEIKVKFHRSENGAAGSITLFFPDKQVVATRKILISRDQSFFSKVKELAIFIIVVIALAALSPLIYKPIAKSCLKGSSPTACRIASLFAPLYTTKKESEAIRNQLSRTDYSETRADVLQACEDGDQNSCLEVAKQKYQIGAKEESYKILKKGCFEFKHGLSCQQWYNSLLTDSQIAKATEIMIEACEKGVALACHEYAWKLKKAKDNRYVTYFDKACGMNEAESCYELGKYHLQFNRNRSYDYLKRACYGYHRKACDLRDKVEAYFDAERSCLKEDDSHACFLMASFEFDYGDRTKSFSYYKMACDKGSAHACTFLKRSKAFNDFEKQGQEKLDTI